MFRASATTTPFWTGPAVIKLCSNLTLRFKHVNYLVYTERMFSCTEDMLSINQSACWSLSLITSFIISAPAATILMCSVTANVSCGLPEMRKGYNAR